MLPAMARRQTITIVGAGRLASTLAESLHHAGYRIAEIITRNNSQALRRARSFAKTVGARAVTNDKAKLDAEVIWFCVPDREIANAATALSQRINWKRKFAFHSSGALASDELNALRQRGAAVAAVHPLMTFVRGSKPSLEGVPFGVEGDRSAANAADQILGGLGAKSFPVRKKDKALYHAWGTFASPLLIALLATAEQVAKATGLSAEEARKKMMPMVTQTIANYAALGPAKAFSGPVVRGDAQVLRRHADALKTVPEARAVYIALARAALRYLPTQNRIQVQKVLGLP
jgi:predicted short-subunit dehydrogenase-like oxidoreductase (DUF2520 family)